jgi:hypothetical protein
MRLNVHSAELILKAMYHRRVGINGRSNAAVPTQIQKSICHLRLRQKNSE